MGCRHENPPLANFCQECGTKLRIREDERERGNEGTRERGNVHSFTPSLLHSSHHALAPSPPRPLAAPDPEGLLSPPDEGENRLVTVLFADMSRSLETIRSLHPEDAAGLVNRLIKAMVDALLKYGGHVDKLLGDGVLAVFGVPQAHEDDPERAIRAALEMNKGARQLGLQVTVGINTGEVYAGNMGPEQHQEMTVMGPVVHLAARFQHQAEPGQIVVGEATYRLTRRAFVFAPRTLSIKGMAQPVTAYAVMHASPRREKTRGFEDTQTALIGREEELAKLQSALDEARRGRGQIVTIIGEAGIGKSRLVSELRGSEGARERGSEGANAQDPSLRSLAPSLPRPLWLEGRCHELGATVGYSLFVDLFHGYLDPRADGMAALLAALQELVEQGALSAERAEEMASVLGNLLSMRFGDDRDLRVQRAPAAQIRHQTFAAVQDFLVALSQQQPVALILEDLHWVDSQSLELIVHLMETAKTASLLLVCIYRPEEHPCDHLAFRAAQEMADHYTEIRLCELTPAQSRCLVEALIPGDALPPDVWKVILERTRGNPLFLEEMVRALIDSELIYPDADLWRAREGIEAPAVPETIQSVILSRVDRLDPELRHVLQCAAVIGRFFRPRLLEVVLCSRFPVPRCRRAEGQALGLTGDRRLTTGTWQLTTLLWELERHGLIYQEAPSSKLQAPGMDRTSLRSSGSEPGERRGTAEQGSLPRFGREADSGGVEVVGVPQPGAWRLEPGAFPTWSQEPERSDTYAFRHVLVQETVYETILRRRRTVLHQEVAEAIEALYPDRLEEFCDELARHYSEAKCLAKAVEYLPKAGQRALRLYANREAIHYFESALRCLEQLPPDQRDSLAERIAHEGLGDVLFRTGDHADAESRFQIALNLTSEGDEREFAVLTAKLADAVHWQGQPERAISIARAGLAALGDDLANPEALNLLEVIMRSCWARDDREAERHYAGQLQEILPRVPYFDAIYMSYYGLAWVEVRARHFEAALEWLQEMERICGEHQNENGLARCYHGLGDLWRNRGDHSKASDWFAKSLAYCERTGDAHLLLEGYLERAYSLIFLSANPDEIDQHIQRGMRIAREMAGTRAVISVSSLCGMLGDAFSARGDPEKAMSYYHLALESGAHPAPLRVLGKLDRLYALQNRHEEFRAFCRQARALAASAGSALQYWYLTPVRAATGGRPYRLAWEDAFDSPELRAEWRWIDPGGQSSWELLWREGVLVMRPPEALGDSQAAASAPRLIRPGPPLLGRAPGDFAVETVLIGAEETGPPHTAGLLLQASADEYLFLGKGDSEVYEVRLEVCRHGQRQTMGRGWLPGPDLYLRLERSGDRVTALCRNDGRQWRSCGEARFSPAGDLLVGFYVACPRPLLSSAVARFKGFRLFLPERLPEYP